MAPQRTIRILASIALLTIQVSPSCGVPKIQNGADSSANFSDQTLAVLRDDSIVYPGPQMPLELRGGDCYDSYGRPYLGDIAEPFYCGGFKTCAIIDASEPYNPLALPRRCPPNLGLCFDIYKCRCEYCDLAVCYDPDHPEHVTDEVRFHCATLLEIPPGQQ